MVGIKKDKKIKCCSGKYEGRLTPAGVCVAVFDDADRHNGVLQMFKKPKIFHREQNV